MIKNNLQQQQLAAITAELKKLQRNHDMLREIVTAEGFYQTWFHKMLPAYKTGSDAFNALNEIHYNLTLPHKYKYSSYGVFLNIIERRNKK